MCVCVGGGRQVCGWDEMLCLMLLGAWSVIGVLMTVIGPYCPQANSPECVFCQKTAVHCCVSACMSVYTHIHTYTHTSPPLAALCQSSSPGFIEYWSPDDYRAPPSTGPGAVVKFSLKLDTDLFALAKAKTHARSLEV